MADCYLTIENADNILGVNSDNAKSIGTFFDQKWHLYQRTIRADLLCHVEMFTTLDRFLLQHYNSRPFIFADLGCGDATAVIKTLQNKPVMHYIGVDAGSELVVEASRTLAPLDCQKTLICQDMATAVTSLPTGIDVILCSYTLHHLLLDQKHQFIHECYQHLNASGYLIIVDGVLKLGETRDKWLDRLDRRIKDKVPDLTDDERAELMQHPRDSDFPETIFTFQQIGESWRNFEVLVHRDDFLVFMVFAK